MKPEVKKAVDVKFKMHRAGLGLVLEIAKQIGGLPCAWFYHNHHKQKDLRYNQDT